MNLKIFTSVLFFAFLLSFVTSRCSKCSRKHTTEVNEIAEAAETIEEETIKEIAESEAIDFSFEPQQLMVYRDTVVKFTTNISDDKKFVCFWDFGDDEQAEGCKGVTHIYQGGFKDQFVTLIVKRADTGKKIFEKTKKIPLERLKVVKINDESEIEQETLKKRPDDDDSFVVAIFGASFLEEPMKKAVYSVKNIVRPDLIIHTGDTISPFNKKNLATFLKVFLMPAYEKSIPVVVVPGEVELNSKETRKKFFETFNLFKPVVEYASEDDYPFNYSFVLKQNFFIILDSSTQTISDENFRWLKNQLLKGTAYKNIIVVTHYPLIKLTEKETGHIKQNYRLQELLQRYGVSLLITGHYPVYYKGEIGAIKCLSPGGFAKPCVPLLGEKVCEGNIFSVLKIDKYNNKKILGVTGKEFVNIYDDSLLPESIHTYLKFK